ncbi:proline-, glutamic acid- and leucine-rich protein 1 [Aphomia sociella]
MTTLMIAEGRKEVKTNRGEKAERAAAVEPLACQILNKLRDVDPNNSESVKETLTAFFQHLDKHTEVDSNRWLRALENIINRFPKYCMSHRNTIENFLIHFLDCNNYYNVIEAARCGHALQQVRPIQEKGATAKSCWRDQMKALCKAAHTLIDTIFSNVVDIYRNNQNSTNLQSSSNSPLHVALQNIEQVKEHDKNVTKKAMLCTRLKSVLIFIQAMLVEIYPVAKPVQPQLILEVLVRALSVTSAKQQIDLNNADITMIKTYALRTLDAMIACLGSNLIPFSALVIRLIMQTLKWTSENPSEESSQVRRTAYNSLSRWLSLLHSERGGSWAEQLTSHVLADIAPPRQLVQLAMTSQPTKHLSKKARRRLANSMLEKSNIASHAPGEKNKVLISEQANDEVAIAALECAEIFLTVCGVFLKPTIHKLFQERLVRECFTIDSYSNERAIALLRTLDAARRSTAPMVPPPTQYCLHLYSNMINSQQPEISKFCTQALMNIRLHLHCSPPSLNFAVEIQADKQKKAENKRKKMSERNRAALDSLLGEDMKRTSDPDKVIDIPDEPSYKKPRLEEEEISDKISLSSESVSSIEISDESDEDNVIEVVSIETNESTNSKANEEMNVMPTELNNVPMETSFNETPEIQTKTPNGDNLYNVVTDGEVNELSEITKTPEVNENENKELDLSEANVDCNIDQINVTAEVEKANIFEAKTQMPLDVSNDTVDGEEMALSIEVAYDLPNATKTVPVLGKMDDEILPNTNDTDDIQITCGQVAKSSQETQEPEKIKDSVEKIEELPQVNGFKSPEKVTNDDDKNVDVTENTINKTAANDDVSVEDMLADFVDEVNDENKAE